MAQGIAGRGGGAHSAGRAGGGVGGHRRGCGCRPFAVPFRWHCAHDTIAPCRSRMFSLIYDRSTCVCGGPHVARGMAART